MLCQNRRQGHFGVLFSPVRRLCKAHESRYLAAPRPREPTIIEFVPVGSSVRFLSVLRSEYCKLVDRRGSESCLVPFRSSVGRGSARPAVRYNLASVGQSERDRMSARTREAGELFSHDHGGHSLAACPYAACFMPALTPCVSCVVGLFAHRCV